MSPEPGKHAPPWSVFLIVSPEGKSVLKSWTIKHRNNLKGLGLGKMGIALFMKQGAPIVLRLASNSWDQEIHLHDSASLRDGITDTLPCPAKCLYFKCNFQREK